MNRHPALTQTATPIAQDADELPTAHATKVQAFRPSYVLIAPLLDHAGSRRQDGWAMRIDLADGRCAYLSFARRKLWRGETTQSLGTCDGVEALLTIDGEARDPRPDNLLITLTPHLLDRITALGYVPGETPAGVLPWLVSEIEELRLTLAADKAHP